MRSNSSAGSDRSHGRRAATKGSYGRAPSPRSTHPPSRTRSPADTAPARNSAISRVLPTPASPPTRTVPTVPAIARSSAACSRWSSSPRPTNSGLEIRVVIRRLSDLWRGPKERRCRQLRSSPLPWLGTEAYSPGSTRSMNRRNQMMDASSSPTADVRMDLVGQDCATLTPIIASRMRQLAQRDGPRGRL